MPIIKTVSPEDATGKVAEIYSQFKQVFGRVPNAFTLTSTSEFLLGQQVAGISYFMQHPAFSPSFQAFMRLLVSVKQECAFCIDMNTGMLLHQGFSMEQIQATRENTDHCPLPDPEKSLLKFVLKVVHNSNGITTEDLNGLRSLGWSDQHILEAAFAGANQVASDMIFNAFKVEGD